jgi:hypothetical protein
MKANVLHIWHATCVCPSLCCVVRNETEKEIALSLFSGEGFAAISEIQENLVVLTFGRKKHPTIVLLSCFVPVVVKKHILIVVQPEKIPIFAP